MHPELIKTITDANILLELVDKSELARLKNQEYVYVHPKQLKSSAGIIISEDFARCQGVCFLDNKLSVGALAHNFPAHDPYNTLTGAWTGGEYILEDPKQIFKDMSIVLAVHVYHANNYSWPERWIEGALATVGIQRVVHIPINSKYGGNFLRDIALDVKDNSVYVFPSDFDVGIKYQFDGIPYAAYSQLYRQSIKGNLSLMPDAGTGKTPSNSAAGILIVSPDLEEVFLLQRSKEVKDPLLWSIPGGTRKHTSSGLEDSLVAAVGETREEIGSLPRGKIRLQSYTYRKSESTFIFETFILEIDSAEKSLFTPQLNWENIDYCWRRRDSLGDLQLHPGLKEVLENYKF